MRGGIEPHGISVFNVTTLSEPEQKNRTVKTPIGRQGGLSKFIAGFQKPPTIAPNARILEDN